MATNRPSGVEPHKIGVPRAAGVLGALALVALLVAACGGPSDPGVASLGSTTTTRAAAGPSGGSSTAQYADAVAFARCMRSHGVANFPDPTSNGSFTVQGAKVNGQSGIDPRSRAFQNASTACRHLLPNGGQMSPAQKERAVANLLKFVQCMRRHGVANMPDPIVNANSIGLRVPADAARTPQFAAAQKACGALLGKAAP